jgi:hypothetical protein
MQYWIVFDVLEAASTYNVDISGLPFDEAKEEVREAIEEKKRKWKRSAESSQRKKSLGS